MPLKIKASGLDRLHKSLSQDFKKVISRGFKRIAEVVKQVAKAEVPFVSGKLQRGISKTPSGEFGWHIYERSKHGQFIREGTVPHIIRPRKALALDWPGLPHPVAWAEHPGIRRLNPYPERAVTRSAHEVQLGLNAIGEEIGNKIG